MKRILPLASLAAALLVLGIVETRAIGGLGDVISPKDRKLSTDRIGGQTSTGLADTVVEVPISLTAPRVQASAPAVLWQVGSGRRCELGCAGGKRWCQRCVDRSCGDPYQESCAAGDATEQVALRAKASNEAPVLVDLNTGRIEVGAECRRGNSMICAASDEPKLELAANICPTNPDCKGPPGGGWPPASCCPGTRAREEAQAHQAAYSERIGSLGIRTISFE
ncbi:MAG: hypothetical protein HY078_16720 [Elusimicrobia bacterium]|nr:hypothetical protein [Elusimicrobiota bacterium]